MHKFCLLLLIICISCQHKEKISLNPYYPNLDITLKTLEPNGWYRTTMDDGLCVYENESIVPELYFLTDMTYECKTFIGQELIIPLKFLGNTETDKFTLTNEIIQAIDSVLLTYQSKRITPIKTVAPCRLEFAAENNEQISINWDVSTCGDFISLSSYASLKKD